MKQPAQRRNSLKLAFAAATAACFLISPLGATMAHAQPSSPTTGSSKIPANWRDIKDGVGGYPAGPMLEIAVRSVRSDKLEMFKWRSEFIAMLGAQPGPLVEREWHSLSSLPANTGPGTWTGMTWWENQQDWQNMGNMLFPTPVAANWLKTLDMTLVFAKPIDPDFDLHTLAQSGDQVLELGVLAFPATSGDATADGYSSRGQAYLDALRSHGVKTYRFAIYSNQAGLEGPYTVEYNKNGPPDQNGEHWYVYMATFDSNVSRSMVQADRGVHRAFEALTTAMVGPHSNIEVMARTTSQVCIKKTTGALSLDPDECHVGLMGSGDSWAKTYSERPQACVTDYNVCSMLSPRTCVAVGGQRVATCPVAASH